MKAREHLPPCRIFDNIYLQYKYLGSIIWLHFSTKHGARIVEGEMESHYHKHFSLQIYCRICFLNNFSILPASCRVVHYTTLHIFTYTKKNSFHGRMHLFLRKEGHTVIQTWHLMLCQNLNSYDHGNFLVRNVLPNRIIRRFQNSGSKVQNPSPHQLRQLYLYKISAFMIVWLHHL